MGPLNQISYIPTHGSLITHTEASSGRKGEAPRIVLALVFMDSYKDPYQRGPSLLVSCFQSHILPTESDLKCSPWQPISLSG